MQTMVYSVVSGLFTQVFSAVCVVTAVCVRACMRACVCVLQTGSPKRNACGQRQGDTREANSVEVLNIFRRIFS